ncbi:NAD(P)-binding protein [Karstenula rhodostoma CBS 690.94]|uniref:NAD(P)-binding protein n=1 Tax=Karstenula rhodostoma CBS 690.94 TaxID=1392251 RepID=A0A9P4PFU4_9PLEO|nr:NAD(P)-binding protein [Karstenula rhodostoma CBS 690.94]
MVKIAVAGGSGQVSREVIDSLLSANKHEIAILSRSPAKEIIDAKIMHHVVDYDSVDDLVNALRGVHTVLSFIQILSDNDQKSQRNLIDAAILAGVKRFAPSEYGSAGTMHMPWYAGKQKIREYLRKVNGSGKVLEYCLFTPGLFLNYLAFPKKTSKHLSPLGTVFDFQNRRAILVDGYETANVTLTTVTDFATVMVIAIDYEGTWPEFGGIQGNKVTVKQIIEIGEKVRGCPFAVEKVKLEDLEKGNLTSPWGLEVPHKAVSEEEAQHMLRQVTIGMLLSTAKGAWEGSNELNQLFPNCRFTAIEDFLAEVWHDHKYK